MVAGSKGRGVWGAGGSQSCAINAPRCWTQPWTQLASCSQPHPTFLAACPTHTDPGQSLCSPCDRCWFCGQRHAGSRLWFCPALCYLCLTILGQKLCRQGVQLRRLNGLWVGRELLLGWGLDLGAVTVYGQRPGQSHIPLPAYPCLQNHHPFSGYVGRGSWLCPQPKPHIITVL